VEALGAAPMLIPPSDAQDALSKGIVEGAIAARVLVSGFPQMFSQFRV
jgi:hypothetical protein